MTTGEKKENLPAQTKVKFICVKFYCVKIWENENLGGCGPLAPLVPLPMSLQ